jgi:hypothetical protein
MMIHMYSVSTSCNTEAVASRKFAKMNMRAPWQ